MRLRWSEQSIVCPIFIIVYVVLVARTCLAFAVYTDQWAVLVEGGPEVANEIASKHGFVNLGMIVPDYYHFQLKRFVKRSVKPNTRHHKRLIFEPNVKWAKQQVARKRVKRDLQQNFNYFGSHSRYPDLNDPMWAQMWYLNRGRGLDMNVQDAWRQGITGKGIVVTILDDGLEKDHPDIKRNYDPLASYDVNNHDEDPQPRYDFVDSNRHGTRCAGEVAAEANNSVCAVGVAYEAKVGGVRMLDGDVTDAVEARSLSLNPQHVDIYSASWGPDDDGKTVDGPGELASKAFMEGVKTGRNGLGSIFVWASGNGGRDHDNCNCDGYTNSIWTLSISSATENGLVPWYSEACSSTLATTYSSGSVGEKQVVTTDLHHGCTLTHTGTSASAPLAAGICALALQVNPKLSWRDMQHIVLRSAQPANLKASDWSINAVGRNVSHSFGYGLMDASKMIALARNWTTVPVQRMHEAPAPYAVKFIPAKSKVTLTLFVDPPNIRYLEHVQAKISLTATRRGDIQIFLISPLGTRSCLLDTRPHDTSPAGFHSWPFMTVHNWGEDPRGLWTLEIHNEGRYQGKAKLKDWLLVFYGTKEAPGLEVLPTTSVTYVTTTVTATPEATSLVPTVDSKRRLTKRPLVSSRANNASIGNIFPSQFPGHRAATFDEHHFDQGRHNNAASVSDLKVVTYGTAEDAGSKVVDNGGGESNKKLSELGKKSSSSLDDVSLGERLCSTSGYCLDCGNRSYLLDGKCIAECPIAHYPSSEMLNATHTTLICRQCHYTCKACRGPNDYQCTQCYGDGQLRDDHCRPLDLLQKIDNNDIFSTVLVVVLVVLMVAISAIAVYIVFCGYPIANDIAEAHRRSTYKRLEINTPLTASYMYEDDDDEEEEDDDNDNGNGNKNRYDER